MFVFGGMLTSKGGEKRKKKKVLFWKGFLKYRRLFRNTEVPFGEVDCLYCTFKVLCLCNRRVIRRMNYLRFNRLTTPTWARSDVRHFGAVDLLPLYRWYLPQR